jgi:LysW-gamma-L-lysine carboxypeptidase
LTDSQAILLLEGAVGIASPSGSERAVASFLTECLAGFADDAFIDGAGNTVAVLGDGPLELVFLGHIDTVAGDIPVRIENGELWGRGSVDAKGAFCTAIAGVARAFAREPRLRERLKVRLIGAVGEESPGSPGARFALSAYPAPAFVLVCEPSGADGVTLGYKGRLAAEFQVERSEFHSAGPGSTAAEALADAWRRVRELAAQRDGESRAARVFDRLQVSLQSVGSSTDGLRQRAAGTVSLRLPPGLLAAQVALDLGGIAEQVTAGLRSGEGACGTATCRLRVTGGEDAVLNLRDSELSRAWRVAIREAGGRPRFKVKTGTSDMNVVAPVWNVPMLAYGPGDSQLDHAPDERLALLEYCTAIAVTDRAVRLLGERP